MNIKRHVGRLIGAGTTAAIVVALGAGIAQADPPANTYRLLPMVGSDTTEEVINAAAEDASALAMGGVKKVASYNATGTANISTKDPATSPGCTFTRPNGSGQGRTALINSLTSGNSTFGCLGGARSSSLNLAAASASLTYIPFGQENVTFAVSGNSTIPLDLTLQDVKDFYNCAFGATAFKAMVPQSGSGTRSYWASKMYAGAPSDVPASVLALGCIQNGTDEGGASIQEHRGTQVNKNNEISFYSVAQWTSQTSDVISNFRGSTRLGQIDKFNPFGASFPIQRNLYNVFPTALVTQASPPAGSQAEAIQALFVGNASPMCSTAIVLRYGITKANPCGTITDVTAVPTPSPTP